MTARACCTSVPGSTGSGVGLAMVKTLRFGRVGSGEDRSLKTTTIISACAPVETPPIMSFSSLEEKRPDASTEGSGLFLLPRHGNRALLVHTEERRLPALPFPVK